MSMTKDIGIDLGTASVLVYVKGKGIVLNEPSVVAMDKTTGKLLKVGAEAQAMLGRTPGNIIAIRPLREGVISDYDMTERMLREFIHKVAGVSFFKPRVIICVPSGITEVEERAVIDAKLAPGRSTSLKNRWPQPSALASTSPSPTVTWWWTSAAAPRTSLSSPCPAWWRAPPSRSPATS